MIGALIRRRVGWKYWFDEARYSTLLQAIEERADEEIGRLLAANDLDSQEGKERLKELLERLRARRQILHINPQFTPDVVGVCRQILAFGAAGLAVSVAFSSRIPDLPDVWLRVLTITALAYVNLTATSLYVLALFFAQARTRYPFLYLSRLGNAVPFFYYQTLNRRRTYRFVHTPRGVASANACYVNDLVRFTEYTLNEDLRQQVRNELQQYYLLIVYQGYLDQFELTLVHSFMISSAAGIVAAVLTGVLFV